MPLFCVVKEAEEFFAMPKSPSFRSSLLVRKMLAGLMSLWQWRGVRTGGGAPGNAPALPVPVTGPGR